MKRALVLAVLFWNICCSPLFAAEDGAGGGEEWANSAGKVAMWAEKGEWIRARDELAHLAGMFSGADLAKTKLSVEAIHVLSETILETEAQLNRVRPDETGIKRSTEKLRLAFDAVSHPFQPLWKAYGRALIDQTDTMRKALARGDMAGFATDLRMFEGGYGQIRPALVVGQKQELVHEMDSLLAFLRSRQDMRELRQGVDRLRKVLEALFADKDQGVFLTGEVQTGSLLVMMVGLGGSIATVLVYASWRKYRGMVREKGR
jgi:sporulation protein YpjB